VEVIVEKVSSEHVLSVNLLISGAYLGGCHLHNVVVHSLPPDTSEYPNSHSLFCYSPDADISSKLQRIVDEIAEEPPRTLGSTVAELVASVARVIGGPSLQKAHATHHSSEEEDEDSGDEEYDAFDDYDDMMGAAVAEPDSVLAKLQQ